MHLLAFRTAYGPPAAVNTDSQIAACPRLVDKAVKWFECKVGLLKAHSVAHDHVTAQQEGHLRLDGLIPSGLKDKLHPRLLPLQGTHCRVELEDVSQKRRMKHRQQTNLFRTCRNPVDLGHRKRDDEVV